MLFFFELILFVLVMVTLAIGELVSRGWALVIWLVATAIGIGGYLVARNALRPVLSGEVSELPPPAGDDDRPIDTLPDDAPHDHRAPTPHPSDAPAPPPFQPTSLNEKWARTLLYNWRRNNVLLLLGLVATGFWYWVGG